MQSYELVDSAGNRLIVRGESSSACVVILAPVTRGLLRASIGHPAHVVVTAALADGWRAAPKAPDLTAEREAQRRSDARYVVVDPEADAFDITTLPKAPR